jgi:hypothetical protein
MRRWAPPDGSGSKSVPTWFRGTLRALVAAGLLEPEERGIWAERARAALHGAPAAMSASPTLRKRGERLVEEADDREQAGWIDEALGELGISVRGEIGSGDADLVTPLPAFASEPPPTPWLSAARLERVLIPPVMPGELQLVSVELYDDGVILHWCGSPEGRTGRGGALTVMADDLGTRYRGQSAGEGGDQFAPAIPAEATMLRVTRGSIEIELGLANEH